MKSFSHITSVSLLVIGTDSLSKYWVEEILDLYQSVPIVGQFLRLTLGYNSGVAFGLFANGGHWPTILTGVIILGMTVTLLQLQRSGEFSAKTTWPVGMFFGGAIANFLDRLPDGRVTDFLDVGLEAARWPTFNLADSFIVLGATILLLITLLEQRQKKDEV
jgi:signal peptidase II